MAKKDLMPGERGEGQSGEKQLKMREKKIAAKQKGELSGT